MMNDAYNNNDNNNSDSDSYSDVDMNDSDDSDDSDIKIGNGKDRGYRKGGMPRGASNSRGRGTGRGMGRGMGRGGINNNNNNYYNDIFLPPKAQWNKFYTDHLLNGNAKYKIPTIIRNTIKNNELLYKVLKSTENTFNTKTNEGLSDRRKIREIRQGNRTDLINSITEVFNGPTNIEIHDKGIYIRFTDDREIENEDSFHISFHTGENKKFINPKADTAGHDGHKLGLCHISHRDSEDNRIMEKTHVFQIKRNFSTNKLQINYVMRPNMTLIEEERKGEELRWYIIARIIMFAINDYLENNFNLLMKPNANYNRPTPDINSHFEFPAPAPAPAFGRGYKTRKYKRKKQKRKKDKRKKHKTKKRKKKKQ